jgi:hypothetical protein
VVHVLDDEKIKAAEKLAEVALIDPRVNRICGNNPEPFKLAVADTLDDLVVGPTTTSRDAIDRNVERRGDLGSVGAAGEIAAAEEVRGVGEEPPEYPVSLARKSTRIAPTDSCVRVSITTKGVWICSEARR